MPASRKRVTLGDLIDQLSKNKADLELVHNREKELKEAGDKIRVQILEMMDAQGKLTRAAGKSAQVQVVDKVLPQVVDWDKFYDYIYTNRFIHLLQKRPSVPGCTELFETSGDIPGVEKFTKRDVTLRSL
jgi:hypothetical protein